MSGNISVPEKGWSGGGFSGECHRRRGEEGGAGRTQPFPVKISVLRGGLEWWRIRQRKPPKMRGGGQGGGEHHNLCVIGRRGSFVLSRSWTVLPQNCCWDSASS
jgi:hypothetical protein